MIPARKSEWFTRLFAAYNRNLLARRFEGLRASGLEQVTRRRRDAPLLLYCNHSSWWDGLVIFHVGRACRLEQYAMMEEKQLREYPFHQRLGAFSVIRENPREALRSIEYAARLLRATDRALWIFPQGQTAPNDVRPLRLFTGAARIVGKLDAAYAAPVALRYEFLDDFRPEAFVRIGAPEKIETASRFRPKDVTAFFAAALERELDELRADIRQGRLAGYVELVAPRRRKQTGE